MTTLKASGSAGYFGAPGTILAPDGGPGGAGGAASLQLDYAAAYGAFNPTINPGLFEIRATGGKGGGGGAGFSDPLGNGDGMGGAGGPGGPGTTRLTNLQFDGALPGDSTTQYYLRSTAIGGDGASSGANGLTAPDGLTSGDGGNGGWAAAQMDAVNFHLVIGGVLNLQVQATGGAGGGAATTSGTPGGAGDGGDASAILQNAVVTGTDQTLKVLVKATGGDAGGSSNPGGDGGDALVVFRNNLITLDNVHLLDINLSAEGGSAGSGGAAGAASLQFTGNEIHLGAAIGGSTQLRLTLPDYHSLASYNFSGNILDGGVGGDFLNINNGSTASVYLDLTQNTVTGIEFITASDGADVLIGDAGANFFQGNGGNDLLVGNAGMDIANYAGAAHTDFSFTRLSAGDYQVQDLRADSPLGTDTLVGIEKLQFSDGIFYAGLLTGGADSEGSSNDDNIGPIKGIPGQPAPTAFDDMLYGSSGNDTLDGGAGGDVMFGGSGDDTYIVDNIFDLVSETANNGVETVKASVTYVLPANIENLILTGAAAIDGTGNELANSLTGNAANNHLYGMDGKDVIVGGAGADFLYGGAGADTLTGGTGGDHFVFDVLDTAANKDTIKDFVHATDHLDFAVSAFAALSGTGPGGSLGPTELAFGLAATTPDQHLIYNQATGALYYDADGSGGVAKMQIAVLTGNPILSASDVLIF
ncbi:MAG: hypothetical protein JWM33_4030 [Caulobacteraceae bacterium]|nr:hypothetical protein [Caulobacteraceae bacterium]